MESSCGRLQAWVEEIAELAKPDSIHWCDGSAEENAELIEKMLADGSLEQLSETYPNSFLHRSDPNDVARTEHLTYVCTEDPLIAGPNNNHLSPAAGHALVDPLFEGAMRGRVMYVIPYCMGPLGSPFARYGVEISDSPYVVVNMRIMTRMGQAALKEIEGGKPFVKGLHSLGDLNPKRRFVLHFPEEMMIKSIGSGYGGNALLGKKCHALRLASYQAREEGWLAEHMLIVGVQNPAGKVHYIAAAFPSACGKTNLALLSPPQEYAGWRVWTVGDDIAWLHLGDDGRLYAINPEAGFFGVAPGTSRVSNPNALVTLTRNAIFTNVALTADRRPWWEGLDDEAPALDWRGEEYKGEGLAAHPNSRFTVAAKQCPSYSAEAENPNGVPISAIVFGGRRPGLLPLVCESRNWAHGVLMGATLSSESTAAATGATGVLRYDPMAMRPFCGYNFTSYWTHWLNFAQRSTQLPKIFQVNWFRQGQDGEFLWPGFGENLRVLEWIMGRVDGDLAGSESALGYMPAEGELRWDSLGLSAEVRKELFAVESAAWRDEIKRNTEYLESFGKDLPEVFREEQERTLAGLS